jgi:SAM-dependent methyltransferase
VENLAGPEALISSTVCRHEHFQTDWFRRWHRMLAGTQFWPDRPGQKRHPQYTRKHFEWCAMLQALWQRGKLEPGAIGLGFAVGDEPLPSIFAHLGVRVLATDLNPKTARAWRWVKAEQNAGVRDALYYPQIVNREAFDELVSFRHLDMRDQWDLGPGSFDFVWSSCALEHLGSLDAGLDFVARSARLLKPGGVAVHTTEYNVSSNDKTLTRGDTVVYRKRDIEALDKRLSQEGMRLAQPDFEPGQHADDLLYDYPPYGTHPDRQHIKLLLREHVVTSILLVVVA